MSDDSSNGHCNHCGAGCTGGVDVGTGPNLHTDVEAVFWRGGHCPACRIAGALQARESDVFDALERGGYTRDGLDPSGLQGYHAGLEESLMIAKASTRKADHA